jgi:hypothetical protein
METNTTSIIPFTYQVKITLAANARSVATLNLTADSKFEWHALFCNSSIDDPSKQTNNNFSAQITDQGSGRSFSADLISQPNLAGTAFNGIIERRALVFAPNSILTFDIQNKAASDNEIQFALVGYKLLI